MGERTEAPVAARARCALGRSGQHHGIDRRVGARAHRPCAGVAGSFYAGPPALSTVNPRGMFAMPVVSRIAAPAVLLAVAAMLAGCSSRSEETTARPSGAVAVVIGAHANSPAPVLAPGVVSILNDAVKQ